MASRVQRYERDGLTFDVQDAGPLDGPVVVLLHGFPQDSHAFDAVVPALHAEGLRTLAPDQRGYSPGARPQDRTAYRLRELHEDVVALLDAAGAHRAHVVGHDWGGGVAWSLGAWSGARVQSLVVLSTPHPAAVLWSLTHSSQGLRSWYMGLFQLPWLPERLLAASAQGQLVRSGLPAQDAARYAERMRAPGALTPMLNWYRALPASLRGDALPAVTVPTTYVWGRTDVALGRAAAERTARHVEGPYRFVELDAGHWLPETMPVPVSSVILDQVRAVA